MIRNLKWNKILWLITAALSLIAALVGEFDPGIYNKVVSSELLPGAFSQDVMTILASCTLFVLIGLTKEEDAKKQIVILGILGYLFYGYGIYVIERSYTLLYLVYMAIFALSFWSLTYTVANIRREMLPHVGSSKLM